MSPMSTFSCYENFEYSQIEYLKKSKIENKAPTKPVHDIIIIFDLTQLEMFEGNKSTIVLDMKIYKIN